jgi:leucyl-tRNA synthetase
MPGVGFELESRAGSDAQYAPSSLERRWQGIWRETGAFATPGAQDEREPAYVFADCAIAEADAGIGQLRGFTIADACARFLRMRGRAVLFSVDFDSFGPSAELEAWRSGTRPREWAQRRREQMRRQFESLGYSCDWERALIASDSECYRWTQSLFLTMLERDLIYRGETQWLMRIGRHVDESERGLESLKSWDATAIDSQRAVTDRIDGVEIRASTFGAGELTVFTPYADAVAQARFVAVSPAHPEIDLWTSDPEVAKQVAAMRGETRHPEGPAADGVPLAVTGALATVPGVAGIIPIVVSPLVDARFGPTAVLGIPELDATDRAIANRLPPPAGAAWKTSSSGSTVQPAARYRMHDVAISRPQPWGAPIPLVNCPACGVVRVPLEDLPVHLPDDLLITGEEDNPLATRADFYDCACPGCGRPARRETDTIDPRLDRMWMWMATCVPAERRSRAMISDPEYARWLPAEQVVSHVDAGTCMFERRMLAGIMQDLDRLPPLPSREPFSKALLHQAVWVDDATIDDQLVDGLDIDELVARVGGDTVRLTMLSAAAPGRAFRWSEQSLRRCECFLRRLYLYAEPRLRDWARPSEHTPDQASIDTSDKLRKRLALWCVVACEKVTVQLERLEPHRAAHNVMLLLTRIQDFESRALGRGDGEIEARDRAAIVAALLLLTRLLAPLTPHIAEELWSTVGDGMLVSDAGWPTLSRSKP